MSIFTYLFQDRAHKKARYVVSAVLMFLVLIVCRVGYEQYVMGAITADVKAGLAEDLSYLASQGNEVAENPTIKEALRTQDYIKTLAALSAERLERNIGLMGLANSEGIIVTRTLSALNTGENALVASPQGRALKEGEPLVMSIEISSFNPTQVLMTTGRRVLDNEQVIGYLFANYLLDDAYAEKFKQSVFSTYLFPPDIAFYTDENGIYGSSLKDETTRALTQSYFTDNSAWLRMNPGGENVTLGTRTYRVIDIPYEGLEGARTGALLFIPTIPMGMLAGIALISMIFAYLLTHIRLRRK